MHAQACTVLLSACAFIAIGRDASGIRALQAREYYPLIKETDEAV